MEDYNLKIYINIFFLKAYIKMKNNYKIWWYWSQKQKFYYHKRPISIENVDIDKKVVSDKVPFGKKGFKYFIGYINAKKINLYAFTHISPKNESI